MENDTDIKCKLQKEYCQLIDQLHYRTQRGPVVRSFNMLSLWTESSLKRHLKTSG